MSAQGERQKRYWSMLRNAAAVCNVDESTVRSFFKKMSKNDKAACNANPSLLVEKINNNKGKLNTSKLSNVVRTVNRTKTVVFGSESNTALIDLESTLDKYLVNSNFSKPVVEGLYKFRRIVSAAILTS